YCAIFPKNASIEKDELVKLWMAQGFLGSFNFNGNKDFEIIGGDYFDNLAMRSFFQGFKKDNEGNILSCMMHDLVHDFAQFLARSETLIVEEQEVSHVKIRHLGVGASNINNGSIYEETYLRTLRPLEGWWERCTVPLDVFSKLKCLRALSLHGCKLNKVPDEVKKLLHLRFLDLSRNIFEELPEAICGLINLQTLKLFKCLYLVKLPKGIVMGDGDEEGCKLKDLRLLNHLQGKLSIYGLKRVAEVNEGKEAELKKKENLRVLTLEFGDADVREEDGLKMQGILEGFQPHRNLETLNINRYPGFVLPFWISALSNLVKLDLYGCSQCLQLPALGRLASLEYLRLIDLYSLKHIGSEWYGLDNTHLGNNNTDNGSGASGSSVRQQKVVIFPKLNKLEIWDCVELEEWDMPLLTDIVEFFPNLSNLKLIRCQGLLALPPLGKLKSLETIYLEGLHGIKCLGLDFLGISPGDDCVVRGGESASAGATIFPELKDLTFRNMDEWGEEEEILSRNKGEIGITAATIMPCLTNLKISNCPKLKRLPEYLFPEALDHLVIRYCSQLTGTQPCLPLHLDWLCLEGELGVVRSSLLPLGVSPHNNYPNLKTLVISDSPQDSLPEGFNLLTGIETLAIRKCEFLDFVPEDLKHLTVL
ncbi:hypothetical protein AQUCO_71000002v1, partial [Aquilegia coerulea]